MSKSKARTPKHSRGKRGKKAPRRYYTGGAQL